MIPGKDIYEILSAIVPLYVAMILGYASIRWWKIFTPEQSAGINRYVAMFAIPALTFNFISPINPYHVNFKFIAADTLQKIGTLGALFLWNMFTKHGGGIDWTITLFSLSTLPNTLLVGVPLLGSMYGEFTTSLLISIVLMQGLLWYNVLLFLYEYRAAKLLISQQFLQGSVKSSSKVGSFNDISETLHGDLEMGENGISTSRSVTNFDGVELFSRDQPNTSNLVQVPRDTSKGVHELTNMSSIPEASEERECDSEDGNKYSLRECQKEEGIIEEGIASKQQQMQPSHGMTKLILNQVWRKLIKNPNIYAALLGLTWSLISSRWNIKMPSIISGSITIMSKTGLGMSMFSLGIFAALQPKIIACGKTAAAISMAIKFLIGPALMAATSFAVGIRGVLLQVSIVQAAIPEGIVPFVFAREYNLHAEILNTAVIFGLIVGVPVTIIYYVLLGL